MKRLGLLFTLLGFMGLVGLVFVAMPAQAQEPEFDPHPHLLVQSPEVGPINGVLHLVGFRNCIDLANNRSLGLNAHHDHIHTGGTGVSFGGESGHFVIPAAPFGAPLFEPLPWSNCDEFEALLPISFE